MLDCVYNTVTTSAKTEKKRAFFFWTPSDQAPYQLLSLTITSMSSATVLPKKKKTYSAKSFDTFNKPSGSGLAGENRQDSSLNQRSFKVLYVPTESQDVRSWVDVMGAF